MAAAAAAAALRVGARVYARCGCFAAPAAPAAPRAFATAPRLRGAACCAVAGGVTGAAAGAGGSIAVCGAAESSPGPRPPACCASLLPSFVLGAALVAVQQWYDGPERASPAAVRGSAVGADGAAPSRPAPPQRPTAKFSYSVRGGGKVEYDGQVKTAGSTIPHGRGVELSPDGSVYSGEFLHGEREGEGRYSSASGYVYDGKWKGGRPHGHGVETYATGERYEGYWKNGKKFGKGRFRAADGYEQLTLADKDGRPQPIR